MHISKLDTRQLYQTEISLFQQCGSPQQRSPLVVVTIEHVSVCGTLLLYLARDSEDSASALRKRCIFAYAYACTLYKAE